MANGDNLESILADLKAWRGWSDQMISRIEALMNEGDNGALNTPEAVSRTGMDAQVHAFVQARIGRMSALQIALAVAENFPNGPHLTMAKIGQLQRMAEAEK